MIRTRFAPSPTGYLHVGSLRTALYSYLLAKQSGGKYLLRVEDTDQSRLVDGALSMMINSFYWAGVIPDEGVRLGDNNTIVQAGDKGPYIQSERLSIYAEYVQRLLDQGFAYYCFCSAEHLEELRQAQQKNKRPTGYDGHCLKIDRTVAIERVKNKEHYVVRLKMPKVGETSWVDVVRGTVTFKNELVDDQVLMKSDGFPTYHLAAVVDDHLMEISHVIRGEEWVSSTPKHLQLYTYFGWQPPVFAHLPLLLNPDKSKLSKRQGDVSVEDYRQKGYLPEALLNFVAFLGWNPGSEQELFSLEELTKVFSLEKINKAGAVFNLEKLNWYNREYIKRLSNERLAELAGPWFLKDPFYADQEWLSLGDGTKMEDPKSKTSDEKSKYEIRLGRLLALERERVTTLAELPQAIKFIFELPVYAQELIVWKKGTLIEALKILSELKDFFTGFNVEEWNKVTLEKKVGEWIKIKEYSTGSVLWPLRVALSGQQNSPGPYEIAEALGGEETLRRVQVAIDKLPIKS